MVTIRHHAWFWLLATAAFLGTIWVLGDVLPPFICGMAIAYLLGPLVKRITRFGVRRKWAALIILLTFFVILAAILALIIPFAYRQAVQLATDLPLYADHLQARIVPYIQWLQEEFNTGDLSGYQTAIHDNVGKVFQFSGTLLAGIIGGGQVVIGFFSFLIITPIVAYFMMRQWTVITKWIDDMIPRRNYDVIRNLLTHMDIKVSGFVRGQLLISFFLGITYAIVLTIAGLQFGFLIGLLSGLLSIIPLVGSTVGLVVSLVVAWFQSGDIGYVGIIAAIFFAGQFLEGNVITPKIMGDSVGLHPVWILFALLAGGALFGLTGMFLAVPVAAVIGVLLAFAIQQYKASPYYDHIPNPTPAVPPVQVIVQVAPDAPATATVEDPAQAPDPTAP